MVLGLAGCHVSYALLQRANLRCQSVTRCPFSLLQIKEFALTDYKKEKPMPLYKAPNSPVGRALGLLYRWVSSVGKTHPFFYMHVYKYSLGCYDSIFIHDSKMPWSHVTCSPS